MSSRDTKITRTLLESGLGLLAKKYEKNPSYGHTRTHDSMVPWALRALGTKIGAGRTEVPSCDKYTISLASSAVILAFIRKKLFKLQCSFCIVPI